MHKSYGGFEGRKEVKRVVIEDVVGEMDERRAVTRGTLRVLLGSRPCYHLPKLLDVVKSR